MPRESIEACLANEHCQIWFLDEVFRHRYDNDNDDDLINHSEFPYYLIELTD